MAIRSNSWHWRMVNRSREIWRLPRQHKQSVFSYWAISLPGAIATYLSMPVVALMAVAAIGDVLLLAVAPFGALLTNVDFFHEVAETELGFLKFLFLMTVGTGAGTGLTYGIVWLFKAAYRKGPQVEVRN